MLKWYDIVEEQEAERVHERDPPHVEQAAAREEANGAAYHGARSARDRDRLRQAVLEEAANGPSALCVRDPAVRGI